MSTQYPAKIKTRVEEKLKVAIERHAKERHLTASDIIREALREFVARGKKKSA